MTVADSDFEHALGLAQSVVMGAWHHWEGRHGENIEVLYEKAITDDPAHAVAVTVKSGRNPTFTEAALGLVGVQWAKADLDSATQWMQSLSETELQRSRAAVIPILRAWLGKDAISATEWLAQLPDRAARNSLLRDFADSLDEWGLEPTTALSLAALIPPGFHQDDAVTSITQKWAERDPLAASAWALDQPDGQVRTDALQSVASKWVSIDPSAATEWFNALPDDPQKSQVLSGAIRQLVYGEQWGKVDKEDALALHMSPSLMGNMPEWIGALDDLQKREEAYEAFAGIWLQRDRPAAEAWLNTAPLPQAAKDRLLRPPAGKAQSSEAVPEADREVPRRYFTTSDDESGTAALAASHDL